MSSTDRGKKPSRGAEGWRLMASVCGAVFVVGVFLSPFVEVLPGNRETNLGTLQELAARIGEQGPAKGFHAEIQSDPSGADVAIQGKARGQTPFFGNVECRSGEEVLIEVSSKGFRTWVRNPLCREGGTLEIDAQLEASP